ncbi:MAG TPA: hypothetical protein DCR48_06970 [Flavobacteriales bacterium]|jgi:hypothetical protein|nr:hypothetical protein [Flavobacteriales bacterium]
MLSVVRSNTGRSGTGAIETANDLRMLTKQNHSFHVSKAQHVIMAKSKKKKDPRVELVSLYKKYVTTSGELPHSIKDLMHFGELDFKDFKKHFKNLEELEVALVLWYFQCADDLLQSDDEAKSWDQKDRHIAFLYLLIEQASADELFLNEFVSEKRKSSSFMKQFAMTLNAQSFKALDNPGKTSEMLGSIGLNPKKTALTNHALSVLWFYTFDTSTDKQDTDAFIEKTSDLLFRLTDTSTLTSMFDLGKFMVTRKNTAFSWT